MSTHWQERERERGERCWTCGRKRGLEEQRRSWGITIVPFVPRTGNPEDAPAEFANELLCSVSIYRNGGTGEFTHLCNECLKVGVRAIKVKLSELLDELDADHGKDAAIVDLTARLASVQCQHHRVCFDHDRMQQRLAALLAHVSDSAAPEVARLAAWEVARGAAHTADSAPRRRMVIVESPYAGNVEANLAYARAALRDCLLRGESPYASHLLYTQPGVLRDEIPEERALGIEAGLELGRRADATVVYADRGISAGMQQGIEAARRCGRPVEYRYIEAIAVQAGGGS